MFLCPYVPLFSFIIYQQIQLTNFHSQPNNSILKVHYTFSDITQQHEQVAKGSRCLDTPINIGKFFQ